MSERTSSIPMRWRRLEPLRRRLALGAGVGAVGALVLALLDVVWMTRGLENAPSLATLFSIDVGLVSPVGVAVGAAVGFVSWLLHPRAEPSVGRLLAWLRALGAGRPADVAALAPLAELGLIIWATLSAQLARAILGLDMEPRLAGATVAVASLLAGAIAALVVLALTPGLRHRLAEWCSAAPRVVDPAATLGAGLAVCAALVGYGVWRGNVSGEGGLFGIYGILKREELDLRLPGGLLALALAAYLAPAALRIKPYQALLLALAPLGLLPRAAVALNAEADLAFLVERSAPIAARPLKALRRLSDRDQDGASPWFGGGDCDDDNAAIGPGADDRPDNGVDEDCTGSDLSLAGVQAAQPAPAPISPDQSSRLPKSPNLVLITVDTLRYDLGFAGYARDVSPNLDALAKRSQVFERAYALASYTGKSVGPMLIGKYGSETHRNWGHFNTFGTNDTFVAQRLQRAKIATVSVHGHRYFGRWGACAKSPEGCGLERGFDEVNMSAAPPEGGSWQTDTTVTSDKITDAAIAELDERGGGRFFLWAHYLDPHADYLAHDEVQSFGSGARDLYDAEVAYTDKHIGRLLDHIAKAPFADRTIIIVTSDHGEAFGENKFWRHGVELWEVLVRVPLIVYLPGIEPRRIAARRSHIDLTPTILDVMGVPPPSGDDPHDFLSGVSLLGDMLLEPGKVPPPRDILIDMPGGPYNEARRAFIHGDLKLVIARGANKQLFDLAADPEESKNVWASRRDEIEAAYAVAKQRLREIEVTGEAK